MMQAATVDILEPGEHLYTYPPGCKRLVVLVMGAAGGAAQTSAEAGQCTVGTVMRSNEGETGVFVTVGKGGRTGRLAGEVGEDGGDSSVGETEVVARGGRGSHTPLRAAFAGRDGGHGSVRIVPFTDA